MADVPSRELQMLVNDDRWPNFRRMIEDRREIAEKALLKRGQEHHEMTRLAGEITAYDAILKPAIAESKPQE